MVTLGAHEAGQAVPLPRAAAPAPIDAALSTSLFLRRLK
jgi:hypothetical protein